MTKKKSPAKHQGVPVPPHVGPVSRVLDRRIDVNVNVGIDVRTPQQKIEAPFRLLRFLEKIVSKQNSVESELHASFPSLMRGIKMSNIEKAFYQAGQVEAFKQVVAWANETTGSNLS